MQNCRASKPIKVIYLQKRSLNLNTAMGGAILHCVNALKAIRAKIGTTPPFTACDAFIEINEYVCTPINSNTPGSTPLPSFTAEDLMQFDCLTELNILIAQYAAASHGLQLLRMMPLGGGLKYGCDNPYADFHCCIKYQQTGVWDCPECPELTPEDCGIVPIDDQTQDWRDCIENCLHTGPNPGYGAQCWQHFVATGEWEDDCFQLLVNCEHCSDLVETTSPGQEEVDCLRDCTVPGMGQCLEYYDAFGVWTKECQDLSIECGCREEEGNEEDEMIDCAADCPNPMATECAQHYIETGEWLEGCEDVMTDCDCYDFGIELDCYKKALNYIRKNLTFEPNNACEVLAYVQANFNCVTLEIVKPDKPKPFPQLNLPDPDPGSNDDLPDEDGPYNEDDRKPIWWYHTDHLGSSTYLTDNFGRPSHYYETLPFGEMMVEHNQSTYNGGQYNNVYKFNGKELDDATGMYYYGARYYDPRISIFISPDPLMIEYPNYTPYHYVHQNPINLIDPTGMSAENGDGGGWVSRTWNKAKSLFSSSQESPATSSPIGHTELDEVTVNVDKKPNWFKRNFSKDKLANDWKNIKENSGWNHFVNYKFKGYGSIIHSGQGSENGAGWDDYEGQPHTLKSTDVSSYSFSDPRIIQFVTEGFSKWHSIKGDENIQSWFKPKNDDPYVNHSYKDFEIYTIPYTSKKTILGYPKHKMMRRSEIEQFDKDSQFDSVKLVPLLNQ